MHRHIVFQPQLAAGAGLNSPDSGFIKHQSESPIIGQINKFIGRATSLFRVDNRTFRVDNRTFNDVTYNCYGAPHVPFKAINDHQ